MKLTTEQRKYILGIQSQIQALEQKQSKLYELARQTLKTKDEEGWLFDVLYNHARIEFLENL